jgi:DNA-binding XRE family transcriptional regulator/predicted RNase H-like HicB family nuclease
MRYPAILTREGARTLAELVHCPGCQTFAEPGQDVGALAREALEGWLEAHLVHGEVPPRPPSRAPATLPRRARLRWIPVSARLAAVLTLRWARQDAGLTQAQLAKRAGVSQQQIAKLESPEGNPTLETLDRVAAALGRHLEIAFDEASTC